MASITEHELDELTKLFQKTNIQSQIVTELPKVAVMNFGRLNPPTRGHHELLKFISNKATSLGGKGFIFISASQNYLPPHKGTKWRPAVNRVTPRTYKSNKSNENPLSVWDKWEILHKFPNIPNLEYINPQSEKSRPYTMDRAVKYLKSKGYNDIYFVVGTDRFVQLKEKGIDKKWGVTLLEHPRSEKLEDLTLYSLDDKSNLHKKYFKPSPQSISGTKARAAAAEHAINIVGIDSMTLRQAKTAIMSRKNPIHESHGFIEFKSMMPQLSNSELEFIIYQIKKGMLLRPSISYFNNHKKHSSIRRSMTMKKGGKRKKKTRKLRGGHGFKTGQIIKSPDFMESDIFWKIIKIENDHIYIRLLEDTTVIQSHASVLWEDGWRPIQEVINNVNSASGGMKKNSPPPTPYRGPKDTPPLPLKSLYHNSTEIDIDPNDFLEYETQQRLKLAIIGRNDQIKLTNLKLYLDYYNSITNNNQNETLFGIELQKDVERYESYFQSGGYHLYKLLGVHKNASRKNIKKRYKKIKKAYKTLSNPKTRKKYNRKYRKKKV